jgi:hypothetical protein
VLAAGAVTAANPSGAWAGESRVKPEDARPERSGGPAPHDTAAHPAEAGPWERFLSRGNLARALRRVERGEKRLLRARPLTRSSATALGSVGSGKGT